MHMLIVGVTAVIIFVVSAGHGSNVLLVNEELLAGEQLLSSIGNVELSMQKSDGNLVLYEKESGDRNPLWSSKTTGHPGARLCLQGDGNLVVYDGSKPVWNSETYGLPVVNATLQDKCNLVLYTVIGDVIWSTNTACKIPPHTPTPGPPPTPVPPPTPAPPPTPPPPNSTTYNFVVVGDWGEHNAPDGKAENAMAKGMGYVAKKDNAQFGVFLGDNFYDHGIHKDDPKGSPGNEYSKRFQNTFEEIFTDPSLNIPFYVIAGNHDYGDGAKWNANITAQIEYSKHSTRWYYPSLWYGVHKEFTVDGHKRSLDIFFVDTVIWSGMSSTIDPMTGKEIKLKGSDYPGPSAEHVALAAEQISWLNKSLANSTADYLWVGGHYPVWSFGDHGPTSSLVRDLKPMLEHYGAHYMCGHDHDQEHIEDGGIQYILSGAGQTCCSPAHPNKVPKGSIKFGMMGTNGAGYQPMPFPMISGFTTFYLGAEKMHVTFNAHNGTAVYTTMPFSRRNSL